MLTHQNMQAQAVTCLRELQTRADDIGSMVVPMFHIAAIGAMSALFYMGALSVIHPLGAFDPNELLDALETERTTSIFLVPVQWQAVCRPAGQAARSGAAHHQLGCGARPDTVLKAMDATFPDALNVAVFGQTEMSPITCVLEGKDAQRKLGSVGKGHPGGHRAHRRSGDERRRRREVGEIVYRGPNLMLGTGRTPKVRPTRSAAAGSIPAIWCAGTPEGFISWSTGPGHDHLRRREHLLRRGRERIGRASADPGGRGHRAGRPQVGVRCRSRWW